MKSMEGYVKANGIDYGLYGVARAYKFKCGTTLL